MSDFSSEEIEDIIRRYENGESYQRIAHGRGCGRMKIYQIIQKRGKKVE